MNPLTFDGTFSDFVCVGDTLRLEIGDRLTVVATIRNDDTALAPDQRCDGYWPSRDPSDAGYCPPDRFTGARQNAAAAYRAWARGDWWFGGVLLSAEIDGVEIADHLDSLWGMECNWPGSGEPHNAMLTDAANEMLPGALAELRRDLQSLSSAVSSAIAALSREGGDV